MDEILVSIAGKVAEYVVDPVVRQLGYVYNYRANTDELLEKVEMMKDMVNRHQRSVGDARRNGQEIEEDVSRWLTIVDGFIRDAGDFVDDSHDKKKSSCFKGSCPNLKSRYLLGREALKKVVLADRLIQQGSNFGRLSYLPSLKLQPRPSSEAGLESRSSVLNAIMEALAGDATVNKIGVWGLGGVGKTTLVSQLAHQAVEKKIFDKVITASVLQTPDYSKIQQQLAEQLGLQFVESTEQGRAARLHQRIVKEEKTILIILDDLWEEIELQKIGVPSPEDYHKGCKSLLTWRDGDVLSNQMGTQAHDHRHLKAGSYKLLFTSRNKDVLSNYMGTQKDFEIVHLKDEEASILFKNSAGGDSITQHPEFESLATEIAHECGGLPIAIVTMAKALKNKPMPIWKDALRQLKTGIPTTIPGMERKVYQSLRMSYDCLESDEIKSFFLLCGTISDDYIHTIYLLKYGMGLGLFEGVDTLEDARNKVDALVEQLRSSNLLLHTGKNSVLFTMHDLIQKVARKVASEQHDRVITFKKAGGKVAEEWPKMDGLRRFTMTDLVLSEFPEGLMCPNLQYLVCSYYVNPYPVVKIPDTFFSGMKGLNVLDLTYMHLSSLPSSLQCLTNLRTLCLDQCKLGGNISLIAELKTLQILSLVDSDIEVLPRGISRLTCLRLLNLQYSSKLQVIPADVIASLTRLENLYMGGSFTQWEMEGGKSNACLAELQCLPNLNDLDIEIPDVQLLPKDTSFFDKLERYQIFIGHSWSWEGKFETKIKTLKLNDFDMDLHHMVDGINKLLKRTEDLHLMGLRGGGINYALSRLDGDGFPKLKYLNVQSSKGIGYVMNSLELIHSQCSAFPVLEKLFLCELSNLEQVCHGQFPAGSFACLRKIKVEACGSLKFLFSMTIARGLSALEKIEITTCKSLDNVVAQGSCQELIEEEDGDVLSLFPKLRDLTLQDSPKLLSFCSDGNSRLQHADPDSASTILFDEWVSFPSLESLRISKLNLVKKIWHIQLPRDSFSNLKEVCVIECGQLLNIFPSCMLRQLQSLQILNVENCDSLEEVFETEGEINNVNEVASTITQLSKIRCWDLPKVKQIWNEDLSHILSFRNLKSVTVFRCWSLKSLFPASVVLRDLVQLQELKVEACGIEEIIAEDNTLIKTNPMFVFPKVTTLHLSYLNQLKSFYPGVHSSEWPSLKELTLSVCDQLNSFASATATARDEGSSSHMPRQPLFLVQSVAFSYLEKLTLKMGDITELWEGQFHVGFFPRLRDLSVWWYEKISVVIPPFMLQRLQNLEKLSVIDCYAVKVIFQLEVLDVKNQATWLGCLREVYLHSLCKLMHIWKENSEQILLELKNLEVLLVYDCGSLKFLTPRSVSFPNLQRLEVWSCGSLRSLMSVSVAKTLFKLKTLKIGNSHRMEEVFDNGEGEAIDENEIVFPNLKDMTVEDLPNLTSFNSGGFMFSFPSLERMIVHRCPKMKIFSPGSAVAPKLKRIEVAKDDIPRLRNEIVLSSRVQRGALRFIAAIHLGKN